MVGKYVRESRRMQEHIVETILADMLDEMSGEGVVEAREHGQPWLTHHC